MFGTVSYSGNGSFKWYIKDFLSVWRRERNSFIRSPCFQFANYSCCLTIIINYDDKPEYNLVSLSFANNVDKNSEPFYVELGMKTGINGLIETRAGRTNSNGFFEVENWMSSSELLHIRRNQILVNGALTVFCKLSILSTEQENPLPIYMKLRKDEIPAVDKDDNEDGAADDNDEDESVDSDLLDQELVLPNKESNFKLIQDLKSLMISEECSDVILKVQEREFRAHRVILLMRSPVFKSMFSHDMLEKESGVIKLDDCKPDTFSVFLKYIYTGSTVHISSKNVFDLYTLSDKYFIDELKAECVSFMKSNLSVKTFCEVITLAVQHDEKELIELATDFFCYSPLEIVKTSKWQTFLCENAIVGNELFIKSLSTKCSNCSN